MRVHLRTPRLVLRQFTSDDVDVVVELDSDPAVMRYVTGGVPTSHAEIRDDYLPAWLAYYARGNDHGFWAAESGGEFVGWFHLRPGEGHGPDEPELGYRLKQSAWGRGLATEGSAALVDSAFEAGASRVLAETMVVNTGSRRVMEKVGMTVTRVFHQPWPYPIPGDEHGDVEYAIDRATWEARG